MNQIIKITSEIGVSKNKAEEIISAVQNYEQKVAEWEKIVNIKVDSIEQVEEMKLAKSTRLDIKRVRLEAEKFIDSKRKEVQELKSEYDKEDKAWLKIKQYYETKAKSFEAQLEEAEKFAERYEAEQREKLYNERLERLSTVCEDATIYPLSTMTEKAFEDIFESLSALKEKREREIAEAEEARIKAEQEAIEKARKEQEERDNREKLQRERFTKISLYSQHGPTVDMLNLWELDVEYFDKVLEKKKSAYDAFRAEELKKEKVRQQQLEELKKQQAAEAKKREEERLAMQEKLKKQAEEKAKLEAELAKKRAQEQEAIRLQQEKEKAEKQRLAELAKAPEKEKIKSWIAEFTSPEINVDKFSKESLDAVNEIKTKFDGFKKWAEKLVENVK